VAEKKSASPFHCLATLIAAVWLLPALAQTSAEESALRAAFVYNFVKFVEWPPEVWARPGKLLICVAGARNALAEEVLKLGAKPAVQGKEIEVRRIGDRGEIAACHVLVFSEPDVGATWLAALRGLPVLSVGEAGAFVQGGGIIGFFREADRLRFEINTDAMQRAQVKISSQLLRLARIVKADGS
jgi:hypothetical protein